MILAALLFLLCRRRSKREDQLSRKGSIKPDPFLNPGHSQLASASSPVEAQWHPNQGLITYTTHPFPEPGNIGAYQPTHGPLQSSLTTLKTDGLAVYSGANAITSESLPHLTNRPPTYVPSRHPYVSPIASGKMSSEVTPLPSSSTSPLDGQKETDQQQSSPAATIGNPSRPVYRWLPVPGVPSEFGDDAPPRYDM